MGGLRIKLRQRNDADVWTKSERHAHLTALRFLRFFWGEETEYSIYIPQKAQQQRKYF